jgi:DNA-binding transcriptional regulator YhcF (GntR family)
MPQESQVPGPHLVLPDWLTVPLLAAFVLWVLYVSACASTRCRVKFKPSYPIYRQVADLVCERVLRGQWRDGDKLPAVKDLAVLTSVNPNTVIKALTWLQDNDILTTQRGVGYFLTAGAADKTLALKRRQFVEEELPDVFANMALLDLDIDELVQLHARHGVPTTRRETSDEEK